MYVWPLVWVAKTPATLLFNTHRRHFDPTSFWKIEATGAEETLQPFQQKYTQEADAAATVLNIATKRIEEARLNSQFENGSNLTYVKHAVARLS